jgi:hypothetical protein
MLLRGTGRRAGRDNADLMELAWAQKTAGKRGESVGYTLGWLGLHKRQPLKFGIVGQRVMPSADDAGGELRSYT